MIQILLVKQQPYWEGGDRLEGVMTLSLKKHRDIAGVRLKLQGDESTKLTEYKSGRHRGARNAAFRGH